jgi:hypothetical protein
MLKVYRALSDGKSLEIPVRLSVTDQLLSGALVGSVAYGIPMLLLSYMLDF